ncbi:TP53-binding protein 1-like isoform X2 [Limulus polyphemus]|uniref:TP53-binding protein 1-like isoform X2 n=1 Tax=Limulus polyphemus TaxID=6850 RepID=A0ABM1SQV0_LIMPO|nr:TP53-binding protein 1-like isoform X2 [Limulus polyphemus]
MFGDQKMREDKLLIKASGHGELSAKGSSADTGNGTTESQTNENIHNNNNTANNENQGSAGNASGSGGNGNNGGDHRDGKKKDDGEEEDNGGSHEQDPPGSSSSSSSNSLGVSTMPVEGKETSTSNADDSKTETCIIEESHQRVEEVPPLEEKFIQQKDTHVEESLEEISLATSKNQEACSEKIENVQSGVILKSDLSSQKNIFGVEETEEYGWDSPQDPVCILQLSKDASLTTESVDDEGMYIIPPSPEAYGPTPIMFPGTPSLEEDVAETEADYPDTKDIKQTEEPLISLSLAKVRKCENKDVQQQYSEAISHSSGISTKRTSERKDVVSSENKQIGSEERLDSLSVCRKISFSQDDSSQESTPEKVRDLLATRKSRIQSFYKDPETLHQEVKEVLQEGATTTTLVPHSHVSTPESCSSGGRAYRMLPKRERGVGDSPKKSPKMGEKRHAQASSPVLTTKHRKHLEMEQYSSISDAEMAQEEKTESQGEMEEEWHLHLSASENTQSFAFSSQEGSPENISTGSLDKISTSIQKEHQTGSSFSLSKETVKTSPILDETEPVTLPLKDTEEAKVLSQQTEKSRLSQETKEATPLSQIIEPTEGIEETSPCSEGVLLPRTETFQSRPQFSFEIPARLRDVEKEQMDKQLSPQKSTIFTKIKELKSAVVEDTQPLAGSEGSWSGQPISNPSRKDEDSELPSTPKISQGNDSLDEGALVVCYKPTKDPELELSGELEKSDDCQLTHFRQVKGRRSPVISQTQDQEVMTVEQTMKGDISVSYEMKDKMSSRGDKEKGKKVLKRPTQKHQHIEVSDVEPVVKQKKQTSEPEQEKLSSQLPKKQPLAGETERSVLSPSLSTQEKGVQVEITSSEPVSQVSDSPRRIETSAVQDPATKDKEKTNETPKKEESTSLLIRVTVRKIVTKEFMYNGKVVKKTVDEEEEEPIVQEIPEEHISPTGSTSSSSRVTYVSHRSSITSGELGDISSLGTTTSSGVTSSLASSSTSRSSEHTTASQRSQLSKTSSTSSLDKVSLIRTTTRSSDPGNIPHSEQDPDTSQEDMFLRPQFALSRRPVQDKSGGHQEHSDISDLSLPLAESTRVTRSLAISDFSTGQSQSLAESDKGTFPQTPKQRKNARSRKDAGKKQEKLAEASFNEQKTAEDLQSIEESGHKSSETSGSSPEIPLVHLVRTKEVQEKSTTEESIQSFGVLPGKRVMAKWRDGYYYPGTVKKPESNGRWSVQFDDGDTRAIRECDLLVMALLHEGLSVLALSEDDYYDPGIVRGHYREGNEVGYVVERDDRVTKRYPRASVILSADQAAAVVSPMFHSPAPTAAVSLDNIVEGRRRRTPSSSGTSPGGTKLPEGKRKRCKNLDPNLQSTATDTAEDSFSEALAKQSPIFKKISGKSPARSSPHSRKAKSTGSTPSGRNIRKGTPLAKQDKSSETSETEITPFSHTPQQRRPRSHYGEVCHVRKGLVSCSIRLIRFCFEMMSGTIYHTVNFLCPTRKSRGPTDAK